MTTKKARATWLRPYFVEPGAPNLHYFVAYGTFSPPYELPIERHPALRAEGLHALVIGPAAADFTEWPTLPFLGKQLLHHSDGLAAELTRATNAVMIKRTCEDTGDLFDFHSTISVITSTFGWGGVAVVDPLAARWWSRKQWVDTFVERHDFRPLDHVSILISDDWIHTRGLRKFGRPDLSIRQAPTSGERLAAAVELVQRFIDFLARGGMVDVTRRIDAEGYPSMAVELHAGEQAYEDPAFNNEWVEVLGFR